VQVVILGIINAGFMLTPTAVVSDRDIIDGQGNTLSVLAEALTKTASGNPVVISDCAGGKARSLKTTIEAIQDLHGYDKPWVGGAGKNLFNPTALTTTMDGVTFTNNGDGTYTLNGTATADIDFTIESFSVPTPSVQYKMVGCPSGLSSNAILQIRGTSWYDDGNGSIATTGDTNVRSVQIRVKNGATFNNVVFKPMFSLDTTITYADFEPYENICPISGRTAVAITRTGENIPTGVESGAFCTDGVNNANPNRCRTVGYVPLDSNKHYLAQSNVSNLYIAVSYYASNVSGVERISGTGWESLPYSFTPPNGCHYVRCLFSYNSGAQTVINPIDLSDFMLLEDATDFTIQLGQTVYGADINWDTGVMTVKTVCPDLGGLTWTADATGVANKNRFYADLSPLAVVADSVNLTSISSQYTLLAPGGTYSANADGYTITAASKIYIYDESLSSATAADFKTAMSGVQVEYTLATPTTIQLTPTTLEMLKGYNRVTIESGSIELGYIAKLT
jgi:hypothetical protein